MKVMCILTDGFEELEAVGTIALLRRANVTIDIYAIDNTFATGRFDLTISDIHNLKECDINEYDALFLPGGPHYKKLETNETVLDIIQSFYKNNKIIAAICAAPTILGHLGLLKNKRYTCFTSMNDDFGGTYIDEYAVTDGNIVTGRSAAAVIDFSFAFLTLLTSSQKADEVKQSIYY